MKRLIANEKIVLNNMTLLENAFKYIHENNLELQELDQTFPDALKVQLEDHPDIAETLIRIIHSFNNAQLEEETFFSLDEDIRLTIHPRYFPEHTHYHAFYELLYVMDGHCCQIIDHQSIELNKGDVCFIAPQTPHSLQVFNDDTIIINILVRSSTFRSTFFNLLANNDIISDFFTQSLYGQNCSSYILCKTDAEALYSDIVQNMLLESRAPKELSSRLLRTLLEFFFIYLLRYHKNHFIISDSTAKIENENIVEILKYMQAHFKTLTLQETALHFNYNESHLSRMIKKYTGHTFSEIIKTIKIQYAANLLLDDRISIQQIAEDAGYNDISYFYRIFKAYYNETPIQYRNHQKKDD